MPRRTWVALLRAVNLGARNKVPMAALREALAGEGYDDVRTYIASGNVVFGADGGRTALARRLEGTIADRFGVETTAILRTPAELVAVLAGHPFGSDTSRTHVAFLARKPAASRVEALAGLDIAPDRAEVHGEHVYWHLPDGVQGSRLSGTRLERQLGVPATIRNWRTVTRLADIAGGTDG